MKNESNPTELAGPAKTLLEVADLLRKPEEVKTFTEAASVARAGIGASGFVRGTAGMLAKKLPLIGPALGIAATLGAMVSAAHAKEIQTKSRAPGTPEERERRDHERWIAEMERFKNVSQALVVGVTGLMPVPGAEVALHVYMESEEEKLKRRVDVALHPEKQKIDYSSVIFNPDGERLQDTFNGRVSTGLKVSLSSEKVRRHGAYQKATPNPSKV